MITSAPEMSLATSKDPVWGASRWSVTGSWSTWPPDISTHWVKVTKPSRPTWIR